MVKKLKMVQQCHFASIAMDWSVGSTSGRSKGEVQVQKFEWWACCLTLHEFPLTTNNQPASTIKPKQATYSKYHNIT
jgi:hypothetical protein